MSTAAPEQTPLLIGIADGSLQVNPACLPPGPVLNGIVESNDFVDIADHVLHLHRAVTYLGAISRYAGLESSSHNPAGMHRLVATYGGPDAARGVLRGAQLRASTMSRRVKPAFFRAYAGNEALAEAPDTASLDDWRIFYTAYEGKQGAQHRTALLRKLTKAANVYNIELDYDEDQPTHHAA